MNDDILLLCSVKLNTLDQSGTIKKSVTDTKTELSLIRNEFRDILLKIESSKLHQQYLMKDISLHTRFVKEGKATIKLSVPNIQVLISNCPTNKLSLFLKVLMAKVEKAKIETPVGPKQRLLSNKPHSLEEISPLTAIDVNILSKKLNTNKMINANICETPKSSKRKMATDDKENMPMQKRIFRDDVPRPLLTSVLTIEQKRIMSIVMSGKNVFFTGSAGTGKSYLLKRIIGALPPDATCATASTGAAACQIGGITLHAFAGIGSGNAPLNQCIVQAQRKEKAHLWKKCQYLIIDEISMVDGDFFQKLEKIARVVRGNDKPFGGIQLILSGDFLQLPPVCKAGEKRVFCFQTMAWGKCIRANIELTDIKRQKDPIFIDILQAVRKGRCSEKDIETLKATYHQKVEKDGIIATRLSTHKEDVDFINKSKLAKLPGESRVFRASDSESGLANFLNSHCPVDEQIELKVGAQVMLAKNLDVQKGLVNGARGVVVRFENKSNGSPVVRFMCGIEKCIDFEKWTVRAMNGVLHHRKMLPLKLAWSMSIHKSQGMTLDCVEVSLFRVFESGQAYVALSRATSLEGLRVLDIDPKNIRADPAVLKFYLRFKQTTVTHQTDISNHLR